MSAAKLAAVDAANASIARAATFFIDFPIPFS
jgi:hypothetical protein